MAKYMLLICGDAQQWEAMTPQEARVHEAAHTEFRRVAGPRKLGGEELESAPTATTVCTDGSGELVITDGPFLETKEGVGGFYLVQAGDLDEVIKLASLLPEVRAAHSAVEIRPVVFHG